MSPEIWETLLTQRRPIAALVAWRVSTDGIPAATFCRQVLVAALEAGPSLSSGVRLIEALCADDHFVVQSRAAGVFGDLGAAAWFASAMHGATGAFAVASEWADSVAHTAHGRIVRDTLVRSAGIGDIRRYEALSEQFARALALVEGAALREPAGDLRVARAIQIQMDESHFEEALRGLRSKPPHIDAATMTRLAVLDIPRAIDHTDAQRGLRAGRKLEAVILTRVIKHYEELRDICVEAGRIARDVQDQAFDEGLLELVSRLDEISWEALGAASEVARALRSALPASLAVERPSLRDALLELLERERSDLESPHAVVALLRRRDISDLHLPWVVAELRRDLEDAAGRTAITLATEGHVALATRIDPQVLQNGTPVAEAIAQWSASFETTARDLRAMVGSSIGTFLEPEERDEAIALSRRAEARALDGWPQLAQLELVNETERLRTLAEKRRRDIEESQELARSEIERTRDAINSTSAESGARLRTARAVLEAALRDASSRDIDLGRVEAACIASRAIAAGNCDIPGGLIEAYGAAPLVLPPIEFEAEASAFAAAALRLLRELLYRTSSEEASAQLSADERPLCAHWAAADDLARAEPDIQRVLSLRRELHRTTEIISTDAPDATAVQRAAAARVGIVESFARALRGDLENARESLAQKLQELLQARAVLTPGSTYEVWAARILYDLSSILGAREELNAAEIMRELAERFGWVTALVEPDETRVSAVRALAVVAALKEADPQRAYQFLRTSRPLLEALTRADGGLLDQLVRLERSLAERVDVIRLTTEQLEALRALIDDDDFLVEVRSPIEQRGETPLSLQKQIREARRPERRELALTFGKVVAAGAARRNPAALGTAALVSFANAASDSAVLEALGEPVDVHRLDRLLRSALRLYRSADHVPGLVSGLRTRTICRLLLSATGEIPHVVPDAYVDEATSEAELAGMPLGVARGRILESARAARAVLRSARLARSDQAAARNALSEEDADPELLRRTFPELTAIADEIYRGRAPARTISATVRQYATQTQIASLGGGWLPVRPVPITRVPPARPATPAIPEAAARDLTTWLRTAAHDLSAPSVQGLIAEIRPRLGTDALIELMDLIRELESAADAMERDELALQVVDAAPTAFARAARDVTRPVIDELRNWLEALLRSRLGDCAIQWTAASRDLEVIPDVGESRGTLVLAVQNRGAPVIGFSANVTVVEDADPTDSTDATPSETLVSLVQAPTDHLPRGSTDYVVVSVATSRPAGAQVSLTVHWKGIGPDGHPVSGTQDLSLAIVTFVPIQGRYVITALDPNEHTNLYHGRQAEEQQLLGPLLDTSTQQPDIPYLFGIKRVGKSSVLKFATVPGRLPNHVIPVLVSLNDMAGQPTIEGFYSQLAKLMWQGACDSARAEDFIEPPDRDRGFARTQTVLPGGQIRWRGSFESSVEGWRSFVAVHEEIVRCTRRVVLLLLDDFDQVATVLPKPIDPAGFAALAQLTASPWFRLAISSSLPVDSLRHAFSDGDSKLLGGRPIHVSFLQRKEDLRRVVQSPVERDGVHFMPEAIDALWHWTAGYAFQAQHICIDIKAMLDGEARRVVLREDVDRTVARRMAHSAATLLYPFRPQELLTGLSRDLVGAYLGQTEAARPWARDDFKRSVADVSDVDLQTALNELVYAELLQEEPTVGSPLVSYSMRNRILAQRLIQHPEDYGREGRAPADALLAAALRVHRTLRALDDAGVRNVFAIGQAEAALLGELADAGQLAGFSDVDLLVRLDKIFWETSGSSRDYLRINHSGLYRALLNVHGLRNRRVHRYDPDAAWNPAAARADDRRYRELVARVQEPPGSPEFTRQLNILILTDFAAALETAAISATRVRDTRPSRTPRPPARGNPMN